MQEKTFSIEDTNIVKGVAIILLLIHHLFYSPSPLYHDFRVLSWDGTVFGFWHFLSYFGKMTVPIFLILSGYGLFKSYKGKILDFYKKRFSKIYLTYWYIWLIFVPIGVFCLGKSLESVYQTDVWIKFFENLFGIHLYFGFFGYNPTWWFISLILGLYLLFPLLFFCMKNKYTSIFLLSLLYVFSLIKWFYGNPHFGFLFIFIPHFVLGMFIAKYDIFSKIRMGGGKTNLWYLIAILILGIVRFILIHTKEAGAASFVDIFLAFTIIQYVFNISNLESKICAFLQLLGKHSFNIFLFHTFIYGIYFTNFVYYTKCPIIILISFTLLCLIISMLLDKFRAKLRQFLF